LRAGSRTPTPNWSFTAKLDDEFPPTAQAYAGSGTLRAAW
jgi:hypothetical protein